MIKARATRNSVHYTEFDWLRVCFSACAKKIRGSARGNSVVFAGINKELPDIQSVQTSNERGNTNIKHKLHLKHMESKATKTLGFLRRNLAFAPRHAKEVAYKTLVRPKLEYAAPIWHPYHETQIGQVEKVCRGQLPGGPAGDGETPVASATCLTILSGHPWRPAGSSLP